MIKNAIDYDALKDESSSKQSTSDRVSRIKSKKSKNNLFSSAKSGSMRARLGSFFSNRQLLTKILVTLLVIVIYRALASIPLPGINMLAYQDVFGNATASEANYLLLVFTGGQLDSPSIVGLGIAAYINASIIVQLMTPVIPRLEALSKEGERGRQVINQITRYLTLPLAFLYSIAFTLLLARRDLNSTDGVTPSENPSYLIEHAAGSDWPSISKIIFIALILTAGTLLVMWLAEAITENGIGNGSSIIISIGIIGSLPTLLSRDFAQINIPQLISDVLGGALTALTDPKFIAVIGVILGGIFLIFAITLINESARKIKIQYARRAVLTEGAEQSNLPIKLTLTGVLPIIFASAFLSVPQLIIPFAQQISGVTPFINTIQNSFFYATVDNVVDNRDLEYAIVYFVLIVLFGIFYSFIVLKPDETAENLQKQGAFIPGIRPGKSTENYISRVLTRIGFAGAMFLGFIALLPLVVRNLILDSAGVNLVVLSGIGGTSVLIIVGVVLETYRQYRALQVTRSYERYAK